MLLAWVSLYPRLRIDSDQSFGSCPERKHQRIHRTVPVHRNQGRTNHFRIPRNCLLLKINIDAGKNKKNIYFVMAARCFWTNVTDICHVHFHNKLNFWHWKCIRRNFRCLISILHVFCSFFLFTFPFFWKPQSCNWYFSNRGKKYTFIFILYTKRNRYSRLLWIFETCTKVAWDACFDSVSVTVTCA